MNPVVIQLLDPDLKAPLHLRYPAQHGLQGAFMELAEGGAVRVGVETGIGGGTPFDVHDGLASRWSVSPNLKAREANDLMEEALPLLRRVHAGRTCAWDGQRHKGTLDADARDASEALEELCSSTPGSLVIYKAEEWIYGNASHEGVAAAVGLSHDTDDATLAKLSAEWQAIAEGEDVHLDGSVADVFSDVRDRLREAAADEAPGPGL